MELSNFQGLKRTNRFLTSTRANASEINFFSSTSQTPEEPIQT